MDETTKTYNITGEDVNRAMLAVLAFGVEPILAALAHDEPTSDEDMLLYLGTGSAVELSFGAVCALRVFGDYLSTTNDLAITQLVDHLDENPELCVCVYATKPPKGEEAEAADIDMSEVTTGNTEKVYLDQPIPEREA